MDEADKIKFIAFKWNGKIYAEVEFLLQWEKNGLIPILSILYKLTNSK